MKRILFSGLLAAGLLISFSGFSQRHYGYRGGYGHVHPRGFYRSAPAPFIYPPVYPRIYGPAYGYGYRQPYYYHRFQRPYYGSRFYGRRGWRR